MLGASDTRYARSPALPKESEIDPRLTALLGRMLDPHADASGLPVLHAGPWLEPGTDPMAQVAAAFLVSLCDGSHPDHAQAGAILAQPPAEAATQAAFYRDGRQRIAAELESAFARDPGLAARWDRSIAALAEASLTVARIMSPTAAYFFRCPRTRTATTRRAPELSATSRLVCI